MQVFYFFHIALDPKLSLAYLEQQGTLCTSQPKAEALLTGCTLFYSSSIFYKLHCLVETAGFPLSQTPGFVLQPNTHLNNAKVRN